MNRSPFRIIFMGTPDFAVHSLQALLQGPDTVVAAVTQPDRPKGRGRKLVAPAVKILAEKQGIPVLQPLNIKTEEFHETLRSYAPDIIIVAAYGRILPASLLALPPYGCINVHGSLLPRHRGAAPIQWAIIKGDHEVGVSIMQMDAGMDTGNILLQASITPAPGETAGSLFPKLADLGSRALMDTLDTMSCGNLTPIRQNNTLATPAPMLTKNDGLVDWNRPAEVLDCLIRGLDPWPTAFCRIEARKLQLFSPEIIYQDSSREPGTVLRADREGLLVSTSRSSLLIKEVQPEGKKRMAVAAFLNGCRIEAGTSLADKEL